MCLTTNNMLIRYETRKYMRIIFISCILLLLHVFFTKYQTPLIIYYFGFSRKNGKLKFMTICLRVSS